jgi:hypothetical protein
MALVDDELLMRSFWSLLPSLFARIVKIDVVAQEIEI